MRLELEPAQPEAVVRAVATLLEAPGRPVDPWWQAGLDEALGEGAVAFDQASDPRLPGSSG